MGDNDSAVRFAHTLKGVGGSIGAIGLQRLGADLEQTLKENTVADIESLLADTSAELESVLAAIREALGLDGGTIKAEAGEMPANYNERLRELAGQIEGYDGEASDTLDALITEVGDQEVSAWLGSLAKLLGDYDYDGALAAIKEIME